MSAAFSSGLTRVALSSHFYRVIHKSVGGLVLLGFKAFKS